MKQTELILNGFEPFNLDSNTKYLILGSFPSVKSLEGSFYYLHPQNKFYQMIAKFFNEEFPVSIEDKKDIVIRNHIALWDIIKSCKREGSLDSAIKDITVVDLLTIPNIDKIKIGCTGKKSYELTKKHYPELDVTYLSSPSPANVKYFDMSTWEEFFKD